MRSGGALSRFWRSERGATAAEFVLILPAMAMLSIGIINASVLLFNVATIHSATEAAARWCMINRSTCTSTTVNTYATGHFAGASTLSPTFTMSSPSCGKQVTGTATYSFVTGFGNIPISLSATACRPIS
jgi:Flp pilus assembly protein TadG